MTKCVYIETTIPSYLAAWPSRDLIQAARQQLTHDWWNNERQNFGLCISQTVLDEAAAGDADAAKRRLLFLHDLPLLDLTDAVDLVAGTIMASGLLPEKAARDAVHIAVSSVHGVDILLTWNCQHIANAAIMKELEEIVAECGYEMPILCTPEELLGG
jgi:predicted nucleic acid-binding protein